MSFNKAKELGHTGRVDAGCEDGEALRPRAAAVGAARGEAPRRGLLDSRLRMLRPVRAPGAAPPLLERAPEADRDLPVDCA